MDKSIYYIAGAGRSGSTLFDIILGNVEGHRSLGELVFLVKNGLIDNEYCSCGTTVKDCEFWKVVVDKWNARRNLTIFEYESVQKELLRNKNTLKSIYYSIFPSEKHKQYHQDLKALYDILFEVSNQLVLIDSSKNAQYILILRKLPFKIKVLHITRSFRGVLNSKKKILKKNPEQGIEKDIKPRSFRYSLSIWVIDNVLAWFFSLGKPYHRVKYEHLINNPRKVLESIVRIKKEEARLLDNRGPLSADHLVAGNKMRMANSIHIQPPKEIKWEKGVTAWEKRMAKFVDIFY